jgi:hypothetical protein
MATEDKPICSRLPPDLVEALDTDAANQGVSRAELIKAILVGHYFGHTTMLIGSDNGYVQARRLAPQLAYMAIRRAMDLLPANFEEALEQIQREGLMGANRGNQP